MFTWMRSIMKPVFWVVVTSFVAFIFFAWGMQSGTVSDPAANAALVNGTPISRQDYRFALDNQLERLRESNGGAIPPELEIKARQEVLDQLIQRTILLQEARRQGLLVTDEELRQYIMYSDRSFRNDQGAFDPGKYEMYRSRVPARQWATIESDRRESLLLAKLQDGITSNLRTAQSDLQNYYATFYRQFALAQILVKPERFISEAQVREYYAANAAKFAQPLRLQARHILIAVKKDAPADQLTTARTITENIRAMIVGNKIDFAAAARQYSSDTTSGLKGGDLGTFGKGAMVPEFEQAAFALEPGTVSGVVQTDFGFHLIEVTKRLENEPFPLEEVSDYIRRTLVGDSEVASARRKAEQAVAELKAGRSFAEVARNYSDAASGKNGGTLGTLARFLDPTLFDMEKFEPLAKELLTGSITSGAFIITQVSEQLDAIPVGSYSAPIRSPFGFHIVRVDKAIDADPAHFAEFRGQVEDALNRRLREDIFERWYNTRREESEIEIFLTEDELRPATGEAAPIAVPGNAPVPQM